MSANAWSEPGIRVGRDERGARERQGRMIMNPHVFTDSVLRAVIPMKAMRPAQ